MHINFNKLLLISHQAFKIFFQAISFLFLFPTLSSSYTSGVSYHWQYLHCCSLFSCVLGSCSCYNKLSQTGWLKTTKIYSLRVLEPRSQNSRCWQGCAPAEGSGENLFCLVQRLVALGLLWLLTAWPSLCLCLCLCISFFHVCFWVSGLSLSFSHKNNSFWD